MPYVNLHHLYITYGMQWLANEGEIIGLQRIAVMLASCVALLTYHSTMGAICLLFGTRVRLPMHPSSHPV